MTSRNWTYLSREPRDRSEVLRGARIKSDDDAHVFMSTGLIIRCSSRAGRGALVLARDRIAICVAVGRRTRRYRGRWAIAAVLGCGRAELCTAVEQQMQRSVRSVATAASLLRGACKRTARLDGAFDGVLSVTAGSERCDEAVCSRYFIGTRCADLVLRRLPQAGRRGENVPSCTASIVGTRPWRSPAKDEVRNFPFQE